MKPYSCKDTGEVVYTYKDYLLTKHWQGVKDRMYKSKYAYKCNICGATHKLEF